VTIDGWYIDAQMLKRHWKPALPFPEAVREIMRAARVHAFMTTTEQDQVKAAVGAAMLSCVEDDKAWLAAQMEAINKVSAMMHAASVGVPVGAPGLPENPRDYALMQLWHESKDKR